MIRSDGVPSGAEADPPATAASSDTIAAIATAIGPAGVGIVRLSGPRAVAIAADVLGVPEPELDRSVRVGWARDAAGARLDQVLGFAMRAPRSFTGEDVAELHGHGGAHNLRALLAAVVERGARVAEPGEFTRRAVERGKLDLLRAEALLEVIHAGSERALRVAQATLAGTLGARVVELERRALGVLAELEGRIDFPEDDLADADLEAFEHELGALAEACGALADGFRRGRALQHGISVALVGPVNAGKSSLLNALVNAERALVSDRPGTTRDWLEVRDEWDGVAVTLIDTAGLRPTEDPVELRGIELGESRVATADVVVVVNDGERPWDDGARFGARALVVRSKVDLGGAATPAGALPTSAASGQGLDALRVQVLALAGVADLEGSEQPLVTTARQHGMAATARDAFVAARQALRASAPPEVVAIELRQGVQALAGLRGVEVADRVLDEVFARFCIGK